MRANALLFDLDGVLVDSMPAYERAWSDWADRFQIDPEVIWTDAHGRRPQDIVRRVAPRLDGTAVMAVFDELLLRSVSEGVRGYPGAHDLLHELPAGRWCIVTSTRRTHVEEALHAAGLPTPSVIVSGDDVEQGKPDPSCWHVGSSRMGVVPSRCLVVEDAPIGIVAAHAAGMRVAGIATTHAVAELSDADYVFDNLSEAAPRLLAALEAGSK